MRRLITNALIVLAFALALSWVGPTPAEEAQARWPRYHQVAMQ